jgi:hypothetical protein
LGHDYDDDENIVLFNDLQPLLGDVLEQSFVSIVMIEKDEVGVLLDLSPTEKRGCLDEPRRALISELMSYTEIKVFVQKDLTKPA